MKENNSQAVNVVDVQTPTKENGMIDFTHVWVKGQVVFKYHSTAAEVENVYTLPQIEKWDEQLTVKSMRPVIKAMHELTGLSMDHLFIYWAYREDPSMDKYSKYKKFLKWLAPKTCGIKAKIERLSKIHKSLDYPQSPEWYSLVWPSLDELYLWYKYVPFLNPDGYMTLRELTRDIEQFPPNREAFEVMLGYLKIYESKWRGSYRYAFDNFMEKFNYEVDEYDLKVAHLSDCGTLAPDFSAIRYMYHCPELLELAMELDETAPSYFYVDTSHLTLEELRKKYESSIHRSYSSKVPTINQLMSAGVPTVKIFAQYGLTKNQSRGFVNSEMRFYDRGLDHYSLVSNATIGQVTIVDVTRYLYPELDDTWLQYIESTEVAAWANTKRNQLAKTRQLHGPGGQTITMHNHVLLKHVTPAMLTQGPKTSWKKVVSDIELIEQEKLREAMAKAKPLQLLLHPECFEDTIPITDTYFLHQEGEVMNHCVASYARSCLAGKSYIYHIGDPAPGGATLEICQDRVDDYYVAQIYAYDDEYAPSGIRARADEFVSALKELYPINEVPDDEFRSVMKSLL